MRPLALLILLAGGLPVADAVAGDLEQEIRKLVGDGLVVVEDAAGKRLVELNSEREFVPASTLKVATAYAAL